MPSFWSMMPWMVGSQIWLVQIDSKVPRQNSNPTMVLKRSSRVKSCAGTKRMNSRSCSLAAPPAAVDRGAPLAHGLEMRRLAHAAADEQQQQRGCDADEEDVAPAIGPDQIVDLAADDRAERAAGHHDTEDLGAVMLGERLRHQGNPDHDFGACADAGEEAEYPELQRRLGEALAGGEHD